MSTNIINIKIRTNVPYDSNRGSGSSYFIDGAMPSRIKEFNFSLNPRDWENDANSYIQSVSVSGMTASMSGTFGLSQTASEEQYKQAARAQLRCTAQGVDSITIRAYGTKPTLEIPCVIIGAYELQ